MIFKYFRQKNRQKYCRFWLKPKLNFEKNDHNFGFWEERQFFRRKLSKIAEIVIITSTPDIVHIFIVFDEQHNTVFDYFLRHLPAHIVQQISEMTMFYSTNPLGYERRNVD
jgi:hypothetical protein